ncbi:pyruvate kinase [bacterium]|nr:pyruvate kinase [bacterium]
MINPKVKHNKTKIVATLGPATEDKAILKKLILAGVDVFRINFSHGSLEGHLETIKLIRAVNKDLNTSVAILGDLQGPKLRIGKVAGNKMVVKRGQELHLTTKAQESKDGLLHVKFPSLGKDLKPGEPVLLDDGKIELRITKIIDKNNVMAKVITGGPLSSNKGFNLPSTQLSVESLTSKDKKDAVFAIENEFDWIALSFVREAKDIIKLKNILKRHKSDARIIAKIEKPQAVENLDEIIEVTDAVMIARGDLGVELPMERVPIIQKLAVEKCLKATKPVIIATQMMESMIESPSPTRAEANDVANAVMDGADAVMLSAETSIGKFPVRAVEAVEKILASTETGWDDIYHKMQDPNPNSRTFYSDEICYTAVSMSENINAKAIISMTQTGYTAFKIASSRPNCNVFIFTSNKKLLTQLSLVWNVRVFYYDKKSNTDDTVKDVITVLKKVGELKIGDIVINTAAMPASERRKTNTLKITRVR